MKPKSTFVWLTLLTVWAGFEAASTAAPALSVDPASVDYDFAGFVTLQISGLAGGELVEIRKYFDRNANALVDADDLLLQTYEVRDGQINSINGVVNYNVPADSDTVPGQITVVLNFQAEPESSQAAGHFLFQVSTASAVARHPFVITQVPHPQSVTGTVLNEGSPVPYAFVAILRTAGRGFLDGVPADAAGNFQVNYRPGTFVLFPLKPGLVGKRAENPVVTFNPDQSGTTNLYLFAAGRHISGRIVDAMDQTVGVAVGQLFLQSQNGEYTIAFTDAEGYFDIPVAAGQWEIQLSQHGLSRLGYLEPKEDRTADTTTGNVPDLKIPLTKATALIYGRILDQTNGAVAGVILEAEDDQGDHSQFESRGFSDLNGNYAVASTAGRWCVNVDTERSSLSNYVVSTEFCTNIPPGQVAHHDFLFRLATYRISGSVVTSTNSPIAGVPVSAKATNSGVAFETMEALTDTNGCYSINVTAGTWEVRVECYGDDGLSRRGFPCVGTQSTNVPPDRTVNFVIQPPCTRISGRLLDDLGRAISNVGVFACPRNQPGDCSSGNSTREDGSFEIGVNDGEWNLDFSWDDMRKQGVVSPQIPVTVSNCQDVIGIVAIAPRTNAMLVVSVCKPNENPVPGVYVFATLYVNPTNYTTALLSDATGTARLGVFEGLWGVAEDWNVSLSCQGDGSLSSLGFQCTSNDTRQVRAGQEVHVKFVVIPEKPFLKAGLTSSGSRVLTLYGKPGFTYEIQFSLDLKTWYPHSEITLTDTSHVLSGIVNRPVLFFRAIEQ